MKPVNIGGRSAYQKLVLDQLQKYYPNAVSSFDSSTWDIIEEFWALDLSHVDEIMQDHGIQPFIDLNGKGGRPPVYKNDFTYLSFHNTVCHLLKTILNICNFKIPFQRP